MDFKQLDKLLLESYYARGKTYISGVGRGKFLETNFYRLKSDQVDTILDGLKFSCKRCGACCVDTSHAKTCSHLAYNENGNYCDIYENRPLVCKLYPITLDETAIKGDAQKTLLPLDFALTKEGVVAVPSQRYTIDLDNYIQVQIHPISPCCNGDGKPLRELYDECVKTILNFDADMPLNPEIAGDLTVELVNDVREELASRS